MRLPYWPLLLLVACNGSTEHETTSAQVAPGSKEQSAAPAATTDKAASDLPSVASMERTSCFGVCPVFTITVHADGSVDYHGEDFVLAKGDRHSRLTAQQLIELRQAFAEAGWKSFKTEYQRMDISDCEDVVLRFSGKTVKHYRGDTSAPEALTKLEGRFDQIVNIEQWIGTPEWRATLRWD